MGSKSRHRRAVDRLANFVIGAVNRSAISLRRFLQRLLENSLSQAPGFRTDRQVSRLIGSTLVVYAAAAAAAAFLSTCWALRTGQAELIRLRRLAYISEKKLSAEVSTRMRVEEM